MAMVPPINVNQKSFANIALVVIAIILAGTVGYLVLAKKSPTTQPVTPTASNQASAPKPIEYQMVSATNPQSSYPLIKDYPDKAVMERVNKTLNEAFKDFGCDSETPKDKSEWNVKISTDYAQNDIFSVNAGGSYWCGGPYPTNNYSSTFTFDMKTGEQITFEKLFKNYQKDKKQIINIIYGDVIAKTNDYVARHPVGDGNCENVNTFGSLSDSSQDYRLSTTTKAISVQPNYPHVIEACIEAVEVPVQKLLPFIDTNSILNRI